MNEVLDRILLKMREQDMTAKEMCESAGISQSTFATWKAKDREPKPSQLNKIASVLGVKVDFLLTGQEKDENVPHYLTDETAEMAQQIYDNKELRALFSAAKDTPAEDLKVAHEMLLALKRKEKG